MRSNDPWTVAKYAPILIDNSIYFVVSAGVPAGSLRKEGVPPSMSYVNPLNGGEYFRTSDEVLWRAQFAQAGQVQELLDQLKPNTFKAHPIHVPGGQPFECTLITRVAPIRSLLEKTLPITPADPSLPTQDQILIEEFRVRKLSGEVVDNYGVVARLIQSPKSSRFLRLAKVLSDTVWSS